MKKILFAVMAMVAIGTTSCGNKTQQAEAVDSVALIDSLAEDAIQETISALNTHIEAGDAAKLQETLEAVKAEVLKMVKENPELAQACVTKLQEFIKENQDKVKSVIGDNTAAQAAVDALISVEAQDGLAGLIGEMESQAEETQAAAEQKVEDTKAAAQQKVEDTKAAAQQKVEDTKAAAKQKASDVIDNTAKDVKKGLGL